MTRFAERGFFFLRASEFDWVANDYRNSADIIKNKKTFVGCQQPSFGRVRTTRQAPAEN